MKPESIVAMGEVSRLSEEIHRLLTDHTLNAEVNVMQEAHNLTTAANSLMLTILCHELLDEGEINLPEQLFRGPVN